jgi:hypothetical protein
MCVRKLIGVSTDLIKLAAYHPVYGVPLFMFWLSLAGIVLMNLLIAIFNSSYSRIVEASEVEYRELTRRELKRR